ncbi:MATE family efflux transporter [Sulfuriroseicoccus oceanibius]|uniref:Multidrug-efflux transporter n=1 Tax=Sulfuriroseicoccus oceanibius TaxID=2707525 RepID=A0A6B3LC95_9BACT|nr:MATE family efflux transporter [Sulfuriroseicoccus oceanibius]QQL44894.1 MATE family efflux transporter [Sulfuriroseicoccus oceanibius]
MSKSGVTVDAANDGAARRELGGNLAGKSIPHQVAVLAIWPLLEQLLGFLVGMTDSVLAGRIGEGAERVAALDALALAAYLTWLMMILQGAAATGGMAMISRATGADDKELANRSLGQALLLGCVAGILAGGALLLSMPLLVKLFGLSPEAGRLATIYIDIVALSAPFSGIMFAGNAALRGSGDTRTPFFVMTLVNGINIGLSWLFVYGPEPFGGRGMTGIALGTTIAWVMGALVLTVVLLVRSKGLKLNLNALRPDYDVMRRIVRVGVPSAIEIFGMWTINALVVRIISGLPAEGTLGAHFIAIRCESLSFLPGFALGAASATLAGQYLGMEDKSRAKQAAWTCWIGGGALMTLIGIVFLVFSEQLVGLIAPDSPVHLELAAPIVFLCGLTQPMLATCVILKTTFRGAGDTKAVMRYSYGSMLIVRLGGAYLVGSVLGLGLWWIWLVMSFDLLTQAIIFGIRFHSAKWMDAKV